MIKRDTLKSHEKTRRKLTCVFLSKTSLSEKTIPFVILPIGRSGKSKTKETLKGKYLPRLGGENKNEEWRRINSWRKGES